MVEAVMDEKSPSLENALSELAGILSERSSVVDHVEDCLRGLILSGKLGPGQRIIETQIARHLGLGQPSVREALKTLQAEGLVVRQRNRGCSVISLSPVEVDQIFRVRVPWETMAVEMALEKPVAGRTREMRHALDALRAAARKDDAAEFYRHDLEFHRSIWKLAGNPFLERALSQITVPLFAFVMIRVATHPQFQLNLMADQKQHERIALAIQSGNKRQAAAVTKEVLGGFWKQAMEYALSLQILARNEIQEKARRRAADNNLESIASVKRNYHNVD